MTNYVSFTKCKKRLTVAWLIGTGIIALLLFLQSVLGRYSMQIADAWGWFLPTVVPTLFLMIGVLGADTFRKLKRDKKIDPFMYRLTLFLSITYFSTVLVTILMQPFAPVSPIELLDISDLWLGPFQGLVTGALGVFFVKADQTK